MANIKQWEETALTSASKRECLRIRTLDFHAMVAKAFQDFDKPIDGIDCGNLCSNGIPEDGCPVHDPIKEDCHDGQPS